MKAYSKKEYIIEYFKRLPSTNLYAKGRQSEGKNLLVLAEMQTSGIGTKGRSFSSAKGGIYLTALTFYNDFPAKEAFKIMANCAVSVCEILSEYGVQPRIKWPNDIYVNDKKICGILIENVFSGANVSKSIVGIGVNIYNPLPKELSDVAITLAAATNKRYSQLDVETIREKLIDKLLEEKEDVMQRYQAYVGYLGEEVMLLFQDKRIPATLLSVDDTGRLLVKTSEGERLLSAAEVSLRVRGREN